MTDVMQQMITLFVGVINPGIIAYALKAFFVYAARQNWHMTEDEVDLAKTTIRTIIVLFVGSILMFLMYKAGAFTNIFEMIVTLVNFVVSSQGSYDLLYKPTAKLYESIKRVS